MSKDIRLTETQKKIILFMQKKRPTNFKHFHGIKCLGWDVKYSKYFRIEQKTRLPFFNIMNRLEEKGLVHIVTGKQIGRAHV